MTFEGVEGCGKSTQMGLLKGYLEKKGKDVLCVREPGGTLLGERIRAILLNSCGEKVDPWAELFLYEASRAQLVNSVIKPALDTGKTVICDRFTDSTTAYQGYGRGLDIEAVESINRLASAGLKPALTIMLDCPAEVGLKRAFLRIESAASEAGVGAGAGAGGREDRFEKEEIDFHRRVREGYLEIAKKEPGRIKVINADREVRVIHREICGLVESLPAAGTSL